MSQGVFQKYILKFILKKFSYKKKDPKNAK